MYHCFFICFSTGCSFLKIGFFLSVTGVVGGLPSAYLMCTLGRHGATHACALLMLLRRHRHRHRHRIFGFYAGTSSTAGNTHRRPTTFAAMSQR